MPAARALQQLTTVLSASPAINVMVAAEPDTDVGTVLQRLNLTEDLAEDFLAAARNAVPESAEAVRLKPYEAGYKPDPHELLYLELKRETDISDVIQQLSRVQQAALFRESDDMVDHLRFYAVVASHSAHKHAVFLRAYSPKRELTRRAGFAALFSSPWLKSAANRSFARIEPPE